MTALALRGTLHALDGPREVRIRLADGTWHLLVTVQQTGARLMAANSFKTPDEALRMYEAWKTQQGEKTEK